MRRRKPYRLPTERKIAEHLEGMEWQAKAARGELTDEDRAKAAKVKPRSRARPVQYERAMQEALSAAVLAGRWYAPGYMHHRSETWGQREAWAGWRAGVQSGYPDVTLIIPRCNQNRYCPKAGDNGSPICQTMCIDGERWDSCPHGWMTHDTPSRVHPAVNAALELKHGDNRPTTAQLQKLRDMEGAGWVCKVIWDDWEEALAWLDEQAGSRPVVLPEGWDK